MKREKGKKGGKGELGKYVAEKRGRRLRDDLSGASIARLVLAETVPKAAVIRCNNSA